MPRSGPDARPAATVVISAKASASVLPTSLEEKAERFASTARLLLARDRGAAETSTLCDTSLWLQQLLLCTMIAGTPTSPKLPLRALGSSELRVTSVCLGSMTFGVQNTEAEAHAQLDYAVKERGVNMIDTAELCKL